MGGEPFTTIAPIYDQVMARVPYDEWADYVEEVAQRWHGALGRVLEVACGTGSVGLELARRGSRVCGVDRARSMLHVGRAKAAAEGLPMRFVQQDMRALGLAPGFDSAVCLFDSLNYLLELEHLRQAFEGVRRALLTGALFLFDVNTELALANNLFTQEDMGPDAPVRLRWHSRYDADRRTTEVRMDFYLDDGQVLTEIHEERAYTPQEMRDALAGAGFSLLAVYDAYTFFPPRKSSDRLFYVCRAAS